MRRTHLFSGLRNATDVAACLNGYDEGTEFPEGSGCSFTRFYFPEAFDFGWRSKKQASLIWDEFQSVRLSESISQIEEIPMEDFARTIEILFKKHTTNRSDFRGFDLTEIQGAIKSSGYTEYKYNAQSQEEFQKYILSLEKNELLHP